MKPPCPGPKGGATQTDQQAPSLLTGMLRVESLCAVGGWLSPVVSSFMLS